jgi:hypothetical protein
MGQNGFRLLDACQFKKWSPFRSENRTPVALASKLKAESFHTSGTQLALTEHAQGAQEYKGLSSRLAFFRTRKRPD